MKPSPEYALHILMRIDLASMNAGKAIAHGAHAANALSHAMHKKMILRNETPLKAGYKRWASSTKQGFGTTITLGASMEKIKLIIHSLPFAADDTFMAEVIHDPTYPLRDGEITHLIPLDTCGYIFCDRNDELLRACFADLSLHP